MSALSAGWKPFALGAVAGAIAITWVGFDALGWKTNSAVMSLANREASNAVVSAQALICDTQFRNQKDFAVRVAVLEKIDRYTRGDEITKAGWATMPGSKESNQGVGQACADLLLPEKRG